MHWGDFIGPGDFELEDDEELRSDILDKVAQGEAKLDDLRYDLKVALAILYGERDFDEELLDGVLCNMAFVLGMIQPDGLLKVKPIKRGEAWKL